MGSKGKALFSVTISVICLLMLTSLVEAETMSNSIPVIDWQKEYSNAATHDSRTEAVSNLIQASDGGYVFLDLGWIHSVTLQPATLYKTNRTGEIQWQIPIKSFLGKSVIQTNDGGYELSGYWSNYPGPETVSTVLKINSNGERQWVENYTTPTPPSLTNTSSCIRTSDGGFAYIQLGALVKANSSNQTEWTIELTLNSKLGFGTYRPVLFSLTETSDGAIAVIGVDNEFYNTNVWGSTYLAKTEPFLPVPSQTPLPTSIPTSAKTSSPTSALYHFVTIIAIIVTLSVFAIYRKRRKIIH
jgi:hypothetical protein